MEFPFPQARWLDGASCSRTECHAVQPRPGPQVPVQPGDGPWALRAQLRILHTYPLRLSLWCCRGCRRVGIWVQGAECQTREFAFSGTYLQIFLCKLLLASQKHCRFSRLSDVCCFDRSLKLVMVMFFLINEQFLSHLLCIYNFV